MKITDTLRDQVKEILEKHPAARGSDNVIWYYWLTLFHCEPEHLSVYELLRRMETNEIPKLEAMTRTRRYLQDKFPHLRPSDYEERKRHEEDVRADLRAL